MKRIALYARVSTKQHGQDPETQLMPMRDYVTQRGLDVVEEFRELGWSGGKEKRPQLDRLMADAKKGRFDAVLVWRFDRFARSTKHLLTALGEFQKLNIDFMSLTEAIDTSTPLGRMVFTVMGAVAEMERELIRERVNAGIARARKQGKRLGRPCAIVDEVKIRELIGAGRSIKSVAQEFGVSRGKIRSVVAANGGKNAEKQAVTNPQNVAHLSD